MTKLACLFLCTGMLLAQDRQVTFQDLKAADANSWLSYSGSYGSQRYSRLKQINTTNAQSLVPAWIFHVTQEERLESVPLVVDGVMYFTQAIGVVYAIDGQSGRLIWTYRYPFGKPSWPNRGAAVYQNRVYFTTQDAYLVALDARTGNFLWRSKIAEVKDGYNAPAAPLALNGKIVTGLAPGDFGMVGMLKAFDAATGKELWH